MRRWCISIALRVRRTSALVALTCAAGAVPLETVRADNLYGWGSWSTPREDATSIAQLAGGSSFTVALLKNGSLVAWGSGDRRMADVPAGFGYIAVAASSTRAIALRSDGRVVEWGSSDSGSLHPDDNRDITAIAAGGGFGLGLKTDGTIIHWGNTVGGLINPPGGTNFTAIAAGSFHAVALKADGSIVAWGSSSQRQTTAPSGTGFKAIAAGGNLSLALRTDGSMVAWGNSAPTPPAGTGYTAIATGASHALALRADGSIETWGSFDNGLDTPPAGVGYKAIAAGNNHSLAITSADGFAGWGDNTASQSSPARYTGFTAIAEGQSHTLALRSDGSIVGWGYNPFGQASPPTGSAGPFSAIAVGALHSIALKTDGSLVGWGISDYDAHVVPSGSDYTAVASGDDFSMALKTDGSIVAWGRNHLGQTTVPAGTGFKAIAANKAHALALRTDGSIAAWGDNTAGQATPPAGTGHTAIAAGREQSLALKADGSIAAWGLSAFGLNTPPAGTGFKAIAGGHQFNLALTADGTITVWGLNEANFLTPPAGKGFTAVAAGFNHASALRATNAVHVVPTPVMISPKTGFLLDDPFEVHTALLGNSSGLDRVEVYNDTAVIGATTTEFHSRTLRWSDFTSRLILLKSTARHVDTSTASTPSALVIHAPGNSFLGRFLQALHALVQAGYIPFPASPSAVPTQPTIPLMDLTVYSRVRDEVFATTAAGRYYNSIYEQLSLPLARQLAAHPDVLLEIYQVMNEATPVFAAMGTSQAATTNLSGSLVTKVHGLISRLRPLLSGELARVMDAEVAALDPSSWHGLTAAQLLTRINARTLPPPTLSAPPTAQSAAAGSGATLSVTATGDGSFTYQWFHNGVAIVGATSATYTLPSTQRFHGGTYSVAVSNGFGTVTSPGVLLTVNPAPSSTAALVNLSTRAITKPGADVLIPGFVLAGSGTKPLLMRVVGPTLGGFGVPGTLPDPQMTLKRSVTGGSVDVASNDNWNDSPQRDTIASTSATVGAFPIATNSADAAHYESLTPGAYTIIAEGKGNASGIVLVEIYDAAAANPGVTLANISARTFVGPGGEAPIPGFVIAGNGPRTVLVRAVGPTLGSFGVPGTLPDPQFTLFAGSQALFHNNDWSANSDAAHTVTIAQQVGAFALPSGSKDAALVVTLAPGPYTVVVTDANAATGVALVEVYLVP